ncbi:DUF6565 domain-containing protein [Adhaeribacter terreus]|uniref:DUF6565 domain-containing protein n=1 Tax=Adhaeribacter terreus TaxID=529703 RepID=A0ABW0EGF4_9BACT
MKRNFQGQAFALLVTAGLIFGSTACSKSERVETETTVENTGTEIKNESEEAYNNFKNWIDEKERDTAYVYDSDRDWTEEISDREEAYNERVAALDKNAKYYDDARRAEIEEMKTRYNTSWQTRRATYASYGKADSLRPVYLTTPEKAEDLNALTPANIRAAYENFVAKVQENKETYTNADWQVVDAMWSDLDDRKNAIQEQLSAKDKYEIGKAKTKYQAMKAASKTGNTAEKVGSNVKEGVKTGAEKTGDAAKEGGSKVGNAASKTGSAIKDTYKKAEDKVDGTKDRK